jgi:AP-1 complex subunit gamma-1
MDLLGDMLADVAIPASAPPKASAPDALADLFGSTDMSSASVSHTITSARVDVLGDLMSSSSPVPTTDPFANMDAAHPAAVAGLMDLMSDDVPVVSSSSTGSLIDALGAPTAPTPPTAPQPAYAKGSLSIFLSASKPNQLDQSKTLVSARYVNAGPADIENFSLQAAVPKTMTLSMQAASGSTISSSAPVTQNMLVSAAAGHEGKPIALRLKLSWVENGQVMNEMATISRVD